MNGVGGNETIVGTELDGLGTERRKRVKGRDCNLKGGELSEGVNGQIQKPPFSNFGFNFPQIHDNRAGTTTSQFRPVTPFFILLRLECQPN